MKRIISNPFLGINENISAVTINMQDLFIGDDDKEDNFQEEVIFLRIRVRLLNPWNFTVSVTSMDFTVFP